MTIKSWSEDILVNTTITGDQSDPEVTALENGNIVVAWTDFSTTIDTVKYRLFSPTGATLDDEFTLPSTTDPDFFGDPVRTPTIAALANGGFSIAVELVDDDRPSDAFKLEYHAFDASGQPVSLQDVTFSRDESYQEPNLFNVDDKLWLIARDSDTNDDLVRVAYDVNNAASLGTRDALGNTADVETDMRGVQLRGKIPGDVVVVYENNTQNRVEFARFDATTGNIIGSSVTVSTPGTAFPNPNVAALDNGGFVVSYTVLNRGFPGDSYDIAYRIYRPNGTAFASEQFANTKTVGPQPSHSIVSLRDGGFMILWGDDQRDSLFARSFDGLGRPLTGDLLISDEFDRFEFDHLDIAEMQDGRVAVTWDTRSADGGNGSDVLLKIVDPRDGLIVGRSDNFGNDDFKDLLYGSDDEDVVHALGGDDTVFAQNGNDLVFGDFGDDNLNGDTGDDRLFGEQGNDTLNGGADDDLLDGGSGANDLYGGTGNDRFLINSEFDMVFEAAGEGSDAVFAKVDYTLNEGADIELLRTLSNSGTSDIDLTGNLLSQRIVGNAGNNSLNTGGFDGDADTLAGLEGDDVYRVYNSNDVVLEAAGGGTDRVRTSVDLALTAGQEIEFLTTNQFSGTDELTLEGNEFAQEIVGNAGNNLLIDSLGAPDTLVGGAGDDRFRIFSNNTQITEVSFGGNDRVFSSASDFVLNAGARVETVTTSSFRGTDSLNLSGNEFSQRIVGNAGDNRLSGGAGDDTMNGAGGNDVFLFDTAPVAGERDVINNYNVEDDQFELDSSAFTRIARGTLDGFAFRANTTGQAFDLNDRIIYETDTGAVFYDADGSGNIARIQFAQIDAGLAMTASEFDII